MIDQITKKWIAFVDKMNKKGIPVPTVRDPKTGEGSITAALVVFSAGLFGFCIMFLLATALTKWAGVFTLTDMTVSQIKMAADYSFQFLLAAIGGYLGRYMQKGSPPDLSSQSPKTDASASQKPDSPD